MNFFPVQPRRQPRKSGWRLWLLIGRRWLVVGSMLAATAWVTVRWAIDPAVPGVAIPVGAVLNLLMVTAAAGSRRAEGS